MGDRDLQAKRIRLGEAMIRTEKEAKSRGGRACKRKGSAYELEVMDACVARGFDCTRTVASGARNKGGDLHLRVAYRDPIEVECKRWGTRGSFILDQMRSCEALVFRNDRGKSHIVIGLELFLDLVK
jgi:hypothetical protein